ncbi:MAG: hypothetical protein MPK08_02125 [Alphaproteobacteria bacterium]|nr:hypothetical protein [Alphaproteobacteria bacterium]
MPLPESPVMTMSFSRGSLRLRLRRLCSRAPRMEISPEAFVFFALAAVAALAEAAGTFFVPVAALTLPLFPGLGAFLGFVRLVPEAGRLDARRR